MTNKNKTRSTIKENAEVTSKGIRSLDSKQKLVVKNPTVYGSFKKWIVGSIVTVQTSIIFIGLYASWVEVFVHIAYPVGGLALLALFTLMTSKVE